MKVEMPVFMQGGKDCAKQQKKGERREWWYRKVSNYTDNSAVELKRWVVCVDS